MAFPQTGRISWMTWKNLVMLSTVTTIVLMVLSRTDSTSGPLLSLRQAWSKIYSEKPLRDEVTVVTAYFNIGSFVKGTERYVFTPDMYEQWLRTFTLITSPVIGYFDSDEFAYLFTELRRRLPANMTVVHRVNRSELWSFGLVPEIQRIFSKPGYPKHLPNTVVPNYSAAMHAKYEVMQRSIKENPFHSRYFCWVDFGLFRDISKSDLSSKFALYLPPKFRNDSVAYQEVYGDRNQSYTVRQIVEENMVWVCGCFFIAEATVMYRWTEEYKSAVHHMIEVDDLMSTDQQVIYAAFNTMNVTTKIQTYRSDGRFNEWFHLGYLAREAGLARQAHRVT